jgi:hypothetical protein
MAERLDPVHLAARSRRRVLCTGTLEIVSLLNPSGSERPKIVNKCRYHGSWELGRFLSSQLFSLGLVTGLSLSFKIRISLFVS